MTGTVRDIDLEADFVDEAIKDNPVPAGEAWTLYKGMKVAGNLPISWNALTTSFAQYFYIQGYSSGSKSKWVSVKERLPETDGKFVTIIKGTPNHWYELFWDVHLRTWLDGQGGKDINVTHWQSIEIPDQSVSKEGER